MPPGTGADEQTPNKHGDRYAAAPSGGGSPGHWLRSVRRREQGQARRWTVRPALRRRAVAVRSGAWLSRLTALAGPGWLEGLERAASEGTLLTGQGLAGIPVLAIAIMDIEKDAEPPLVAESTT